MRELVPHHFWAFTLLIGLLLFEGIFLILSVLSVSPIAEFLMNPDLQHPSAITQKVMQFFNLIGVTPNFNSFAMVILENSKNEILITKEYRRGLKKIIFGFPGGLIDKKETPIKAIKRELLEETGYTGKNWKPLFSFINSGTYNCGYGHIFVAKLDKLKKKIKLSDEIENMQWISVSKLKKLVFNKNILPAGLVASTLYYLNYKNNSLI